MSFNKTLLQEITDRLNKPKKPRIPRNQWQHPGEVTEIPSRNITMKGVSYPVLGVDANGYAQMMQPSGEYRFSKGPVTEYPMMQFGRERNSSDNTRATIKVPVYNNPSTIKATGPFQSKDNRHWQSESRAKERQEAAANFVTNLSALGQYAPHPFIRYPAMVLNSASGLVDGYFAHQEGDIQNRNINLIGSVPVPGYSSLKTLGTGFGKKLSDKAFRAALMSAGLDVFGTAADLTNNFGLEKRYGGTRRMQRGGRLPIYVDDPKDKRLKSYQDSLSLYNMYKANEKFFRNNKELINLGDFEEASRPRTDQVLTNKDKKRILTQPAFDKWGEPNQDNYIEILSHLKNTKGFRKTIPLAKKTRIAPVSKEEIIYGDSIYGGILSQYYRYAKPKQKVELRKPESVIFQVESSPQLAQVVPIPQAPVKRTPINYNQGTALYAPTPYHGSGAGAFVGYRTPEGETVFVEPQDYERMGVPKYGAQYIEQMKTAQGLLNPLLLNKQPGGELSYAAWKKKYNLRETPDYNLKRAWELGYTPDATGHLPTVDNRTGQFLKAKGHPTLQLEIDWFNSPEGAEFKSRNTIDSSGKYYRYVPKAQWGYDLPKVGSRQRVATDNTKAVIPQRELRSMNEYLLNQALANQAQLKPASKPIDIDERNRRNKQYARQYGRSYDENTGAVGPAVSSNVEKTMNRAMENIVEPMLEMEMITSGAPLVGRGLKSAGKYLTEETALKNAYKYNPWANKGDIGYTDLMRIQEKNVVPLSQLARENKLFPSWLNSEENARKFAEREKHFGEWFTKDKTDLDWYQEDREFRNPEIINIKVPNDILHVYNVNNVPSAKSLSRAHDREFIIPKEIQNQFKPNWLKGYQKYPTVHSDINRLNADNLASIVDLGTDISKGQGNFNFGVYPFKKDPRFVLKVDDVESSKRLNPKAAAVTDIPDLMRNIQSSNVAKVFRDVDFTGKKLPLNHKVYDSRFLRSNYPVAGRVMNRVEGLNLYDIPPEDLDNISVESLQKMMDDVRMLNQNKIAVDFQGENILYDPVKKQFNFLDLSKNELDPYMEWVYGQDQGMLNPQRIKDDIVKKFIGSINRSVHDNEGMYDPNWLSELMNRLNNRMLLVKKKGGQMTYPFMKDGGQNEYKGSSIVDYLASKGYRGGKNFRKELAEKYDVEGYNFTADKNIELLNKLRQNDQILRQYAQNQKPVVNPQGADIRNQPSVKDRILRDLMVAPFSKPVIYNGLNVRTPVLPSSEGSNSKSNLTPSVKDQKQQPVVEQRVPYGPLPASTQNRYSSSLGFSPQEVASVRTNSDQVRGTIHSNGLGFLSGQPIVANKQVVYDQIPRPSSVIQRMSPVQNDNESSWYQRAWGNVSEAFKNSGLDYSGMNLGAPGSEGFSLGESINEIPEHLTGLLNGISRKWESLQKEDDRAIKKPSKGLFPTANTAAKRKEVFPVIPYGYNELYTVPDIKHSSDSLVSFTNTFDNDEGARYYIGHKAKEVTGAGAQSRFDNSRAVAHFLRDSDILPNQKFAPDSWTVSKGYKYQSTSPGKALSATGFNEPDRYRMLYRPNPNNDGTYLVKYVRNKELTNNRLKELQQSGWGTDFTVSAQHKYSDIDWDKEGSATGYAAASKWLPLKSGSHTYIPYKNKDGFSRFSGGSGIYLFKEPKSGKSIGVDISGSVNTIKKVGKDIIKTYGIKPEDLEFAYHDMGSYSAKPKAKSDVLDYNQWLDYNTYNRGFSGAPLIIPVKRKGGLVQFQLGDEIRERAIALENDLQGKYVSPFRESTMHYAMDKGIKTGFHNGPLDAVRHASSAAAMSSIIPSWMNMNPLVMGANIGISNLAGFAHELTNSNPLRELGSDMYNNFIGSLIGVLPVSDKRKQDMILGALKNGVLSNLSEKKSGGEMIRRADGSYSRRGLWDNIRANRGSGKKPTKEMLKQERKIRAEEKQFGGILLNDKDMYNYYNPFMMQNGGEPDGSMALGQIDAAMDKLMNLRKFIQPDSDLEPWVSSKLTLMDHYADAVSDYMQYNPEANGDMEMMEMSQGGGIPERYKNMGFSKTGVKKKSNRPGKKWMVLAKKGDQYKVVHGGYKGMQDYTQHGSEQRRKNFWNRMGGKNSSKATDPFSPLYWHKRFGTWESGGEIPEMYKNGGGYYGYDGQYHSSKTPTWSSNSGYEYGGYVPELAYGGIHINPANKGKFTASAKRAGMGVQEFASHVLANREDYSPTQVKRANFARNASKWKKQEGGPMVGDEMDVTPEELEMLRQMGYQFEIV